MLTSNAFSETEKVKTWAKHSQIPEGYYSPNLKTLRYHFLKYEHRKVKIINNYYTKPSSQPTALRFNLQKGPKIVKKELLRIKRKHV